MSVVTQMQRDIMQGQEWQKLQLKMDPGKRIRGTLSMRTVQVMFMDGWMTGHLIKEVI